jgi:hypothetical protein
MPTHTFRIRCALSGAAFAALLLAFFRISALSGGQGAVSMSRPGQEDLTFWANHNGLAELDVEGEVGFGDMARILMRRRSNSDRMRALRDRFAFRVQEMAALDTPDLFRVELSDDALVWRSQPKEIVVTRGRIFNLPVVIRNRGSASVQIALRYGSDTPVSGTIPAGSTAGYFLKVIENAPGVRVGQVTLSFGGGAPAEALLRVDVRPTATLRVHLAKPARVYLTAADDLAYAPKGAISRITAMSAEYYFHAEKTFDVELPAGKTLIEATRGIEYELARSTVDLPSGRLTEVILPLRRWRNMAREGWYSSDAHIHANYTAVDHQVITPEDVRLQTLAEDLNNANMMVANSGGSFIHDERYFEGKPSALSRRNYIMYWNEEMRNRGLYGHMCFFNLKTLVRPLYTGFPDSPEGDDYPANYTLAEGAQKQGGAVTYAHPGYAANFEGASARELPVDLALGQIDAMDVLSNNFEDVSMELWYRLLNCGFRLAISAGTDSFTNVADHYTPGGGRVYVHAGQPLDYQQWTRNYKRGRSFASNGPSILYTLDGREPGDEIRMSAGAARKFRLKALVESQIPLDRVEVIVNGKPLVSRSAAGQKRIALDEPIALERSSWVAVRALGPWHRLVLNDAGAFAHTSPVYVYFGDQPISFRGDVRFYIDWVERLIARVKERGRFTTPERLAEVVALFERALGKYRQIEATAAP